MAARNTRLGPEPRSSEITPEKLYLGRRAFIRNAALFAATATAVGGGLRVLTRGRRVTRRGQADGERAGDAAAGLAALPIARRGEEAGGETPTREPMLYAAVIAALLLVRFVVRISARLPPSRVAD